MAQTKTYEWRDPTGITRWAEIVLIFDIVIDSLNLGSEILWSSTWTYAADTVNLTPPQIAHMVFDLLQPLKLLAGIVLIAWLLRLSKNAHTLSSRPQTGPWWTALWWYLIPFASVYKPYAALQEVWDASAGRDGPSDPMRRAIGVFWAANIMCNVIGWISFRAKIDSPMIDAPFHLASIVVCAALFVIARRIGKMQTEKHIANAFSDPGEERPLSVLERLNS